MTNVLWTAALTSMLILMYVGYYIKNPGYYYLRSPVLSGQVITGIEVALGLIVSICAGILLEDLKVILYSFFATVISSFIIVTLSVFYNVWFVFGQYKTWTGLWDWELLMGISAGNSFAMIFPSLFAISLFGVLVGAFVKDTIL